MLTKFKGLIIAIAFVLLIPNIAFAQEPHPQQEGVYYQKQSDGRWHEVWNFPDYRCQPDCKLTIALDKQPRSELGEENPHYQLGETVSMRIILFDIEYFGSDSVKSLGLSIWGNTHVQETMEIKPEEPLIYEYKIGDDFNTGEYKIFGLAGGMNQELFFTVYDPSIPNENLEQPVDYPRDIEPLLDEGYALVNEKKYAEALTYFDKVLEMTDDKIVQGQAFLGKGAVYQNMKEYETALQYYDKVLEIEPTHAQTIFHKGILYQETKEWQNSIDMFKQVLDYPEENIAGYIEYNQERLDAHQKVEERNSFFDAIINFFTNLFKFS